MPLYYFESIVQIILFFLSWGICAAPHIKALSTEKPS